MKMILSIAILASSNFAFSESNFVDYYLAPSRKYLDWSTPSKIAKTFVGSRLRAHELNPRKTRVKTAMGHGMIHYKCNLPGGETVEAWSGITGQADSKLSQSMVFKQKIGINVLFHPFEDGYIQDEETVRATLTSYRGRSERDSSGTKKRLQPLFLRRSIDSQTCQTLHDFYLAFSSKSFGHAPTSEEVSLKRVEDRLLFGLTLEPAELYNKNGASGILGGGCTSYGAAYLQLAGVYNSSWDKYFKMNLQIAPELMGSEEQPAPIKSILFGKLGKSWEHDSDKLTALSFYDPEMIWDFFDTLRACSGDKETHNTCTDDVQNWLKDQGHEAVLIKEEVTGVYKEKDFSNSIKGIELITR